MLTVFSIIGFIVTCLILFTISIATVLVAVNTLGRFNIGGVPNSFVQKLVTLTFIAIVVLAWMLLLSNAPFTISITK